MILGKRIRACKGHKLNDDKAQVTVVVMTEQNMLLAVWDLFDTEILPISGVRTGYQHKHTLTPCT